MPLFWDPSPLRASFADVKISKNELNAMIEAKLKHGKKVSKHSVSSSDSSDEEDQQNDSE